MTSKWDQLKQELSGEPAAPAAPAANATEPATDKWGTLRQQLNVKPAEQDTRSALQKAYPTTDFSKQTLKAADPNAARTYVVDEKAPIEEKIKAGAKTGLSWLGSKLRQIPVVGDYLKTTGTAIKESYSQMNERLGDAFETLFAGVGGTKLSTYQKAPTSSPEARKKYIDEAPKVTGAEMAGKTGLAALSVAMNVPNPITGLVPVSVISSQIEAGKTLPGVASVPSKVVGKGFDILNTALGGAGVEFVNQTADALPLDDNQKNDIKANLAPLAGETAAFFGTLGLIHSITKGSTYAKQGITKLPVNEGVKTGLSGAADITGSAAQFGMSPVTTTFNLFRGKLFTKIQERQSQGTPIDANESKKIISETIKEIPIEDTPEIKDVTDFARARLEDLKRKAKGTEVYDASTGKSRKIPGENLTANEINEINFLKNNTDPAKIARQYGIPLEPVMKVGPVEIHTRQPLVLENLMRDQEDLTYTKVDALGKDLNGNPIAADFTWDYKNQKGTIRYTEDTTAEEIAHELGHYVDHTAGAPNKARLTDLIPSVDENPAAVTRSLTGYIMSGRQRKPGDVAMQKAVIKTTKMINQAVDALTKGSDKYVSERFADAVREMIKSPEAQKKFPKFYDFVDYYLNSGRKDPITTTVKKAGGKKKGATVINPDIFKEKYKDFADENHPKYSKMAKEQYTAELKTNKNDLVKFTGGGPGSGKSEIVLENITKGFNGIVVDGTLADYSSTVKKINQATNAGKRVEFNVILPRIQSAWKFVQKRYILTDRDVPLEKFANLHAGFIKTLESLVQNGYVVNLKDTRDIFSLTEAKKTPYINDPAKILDILSQVRYDEGELVSELKNVKLSEKSRRKALATREMDRRAEKGIPGSGEQVRPETSGSPAKMAPGQRTGQRITPAEKSDVSLRLEKEAGFLLRQKAAEFVAGKSVKLRTPEENPEKFRTQAELLTTRVLKSIGDKPTTKLETIKNQLNQQGVKQQEKTIILDALASFENVGTKEGEKFYRAETGFTQSRGTTALDVVKFEADELGNTDIRDQALKVMNEAELKAIPGNAIVWVTKKKSDAARYGEAEQITLPAGSRIIAEDGDGGFLVVKNTGKPGEIPTAEFKKRVQEQLLPLKINQPPEDLLGYRSRYETITLPNELRGNVANYAEHIWESPIKTSAGQIHWGDGNTNQVSKNYFGHTRVEDMDDVVTTFPKEHPYGYTTGGTRRVIEVQSDLYQRGRLEDETTQYFSGRIWNTDAIKKFDEGAELYRKYDDGTEAIIVTRSDLDAALNDSAVIVEGLRTPEQIKSKAKLLQYKDPTAHFRMVREEVALAARDGKTKLQFPTGETAMKIEGLVSEYDTWTTEPSPQQRTQFGDYIHTRPTEAIKLKPEQIKPGMSVFMSGFARQEYVITKSLGEGKFRAVSRQGYDGLVRRGYRLEEIPDSETEAYDVSRELDKSNPIFKFYEQELAKYLRSRYQAKTITDEQGVTWNEVEIKPEMAGDVEAFRRPKNTATNPKNNDPIETAKKLGFRDWQESGIDGTPNEAREMAEQFWAKTEQPGIYYHLGPEKISGKFDVNKTRYNPAARRGVSMINGMYLSTDPKAIKEFYGMDMESVTTKAYGNPRWLDLMDRNSETKFLSEVEEKYSVKDGAPEFGRAIAKELTARGYDGIKYFDPWATGEEYVLVNTAAVSHKPGGEEPFRIKDDFAKIGIKIDDSQETKIKELNKKFFGNEDVKFVEQILTPDGQEALGAYKDAMIRVLRGQGNAKDTYLHEAVHKYLDVVSSADEHVDLLMAGREKYKIDDFAQIEERIAEDFIDYAKTREGITGKLKLAFDSLLMRIERFFGNEDKVKALYIDIMSGQAAKTATRTEITPEVGRETTSTPIPAPMPNQADKTTSKDSFEDFLSKEFSNTKEDMPVPEEKISTKDEVIQRIMEQEYDAIKKTNQRKLMSDIKALGGVKTDPTLREEMSTLPIDILRKKGVGPDEMVEMLNEKGYKFGSVSDLFEAIESVRSMPSRYYVPKTNLQEKIAYLGKIKAQVAKANPELANKIAALIKRMGTQVNKPRAVTQTKAKLTAGTGLDTGKRVSGPSYNPDKFNTAADVESLFKDISASAGEFAEQRISKNNEDIQRLSRMVNISVEDLLKTKPGSIANAETVRRAVELSMDCVHDLRDYTRTINEYAPTQEQLATVKKKLLRTMGVMKVVSGFRTEASNIFRSFNIDKTSSENAIIQETLVELKKIDAEAAGDLEAYAKKTKELMEPTNADKAWHLWYASILSGASTQVKNFAGNMFNMMGELAVQGVTNPKGFNDAAQGLWNGLALGKKEFSRIMREGQTNKFEERGVKPIVFTLGAEKATGWQKTARERAAWILNRADYVGRFMAATDAYFREGFYGMEMRSMAREQMQKKGYVGGGLKQRIDEYIANPEDNAANQVMEYALRGTYNNKPNGVVGAIANGLGGIVRGIEKISESAKEWKNPYAKYGTLAVTMPAGIFARMVLPFTRVVANVTNVSLDWTPLGFSRTLDPKMTSRQRKQEFGRSFIGTAAMFYLGNMAAQGMLSGTGPTDSKKKQQLKDSGWQPNSIKIGEKWFPYQNWGPMALPMTLVGNYFDHARYNDAGEGDLAARLTIATLGSARSIVDMSFLSGVSGLSSAMENMDRGGERYFQNFAAQQVSSVVPNLVKQTARYFDPTQYETTDIKSQILSNMRITTGLKPRLNVFGQPIKGTALTQLQPTDVTKDATIRFLAENSLWITVPSKSTKIRPTKEFAKLPKGGRQMSEDEYYNYVKYSGIEIKKRLDKMLPRLEKMTSEAREKEIDNIVQDVREATKRGLEMGLIK